MCGLGGAILFFGLPFMMATTVGFFTVACRLCLTHSLLLPVFCLSVPVPARSCFDLFLLVPSYSSSRVSLLRCSTYPSFLLPYHHSPIRSEALGLLHLYLPIQFYIPYHHSPAHSEAVAIPAEKPSRLSVFFPLSAFSHSLRTGRIASPIATHPVLYPLSPFSRPLRTGRNPG